MDDRQEQEQVFSVRPYARDAGRCSRCLAPCPGYDAAKAGLRRWRTLDVGMVKTYLQAQAPQVACTVPCSWQRGGPITLASSSVGEVAISSIDREGAGMGYDLGTVREVAAAISVPVVALGGAATNADFTAALRTGASAVAVSSRFIFHGKHRAVLITYPSHWDPFIR